MKKVNFYNTFEISVPIWNWLFPYLEEKGWSPYAILSSGKYRKDKLSKINQYTKWVWVPSFLKNKKAFNHLFYILFAPFFILFERPLINIFYTQPPFALSLFAFFSRLKGVPYIVHIMDYHPELLVANGRLKKNSFLYKFLDNRYVNALKKAEKVIVLGDCMLSLISDKGIDRNKIKIIHNVSSNEELPKVSLEAISDLKDRLNVGDRKLLLYSGNMGIAHEFQTILSCISKFKDDLFFLFAGKGHRRNELEKFEKEHQPSNMKLLSYLPDGEFELVLRSADIHFISLRDFFEGIMVPSKLYSSLAIGKPILFEGNKNSEVTKSINNCGFYVPHLDSSKMEVILKSLIESDVNLKELGVKAKNKYDMNYHSSVFCKKYENILNEVNL